MLHLTINHTQKRVARYDISTASLYILNNPKHPCFKTFRSCKYMFIFGSVLHGDIPEQVAHALLVVDPSDGLRQQDGDVHSLDLMSL